MAWSTVIAVLGVLIGTGGVAALVTSRGQLATLKAEALLQAQSFYERTLAGQNEHIQRLEARVDELTSRVDVVSESLQTAESARAISEERREAAEAALFMVWAWIDAGAEPPTPERPSWVPVVGREAQ